MMLDSMQSPTGGDHGHTKAYITRNGIAIALSASNATVRKIANSRINELPCHDALPPCGRLATYLRWSARAGKKAADIHSLRSRTSPPCGRSACNADRPLLSRYSGTCAREFVWGAFVMLRVSGTAVHAATNVPAEVGSDQITTAESGSDDCDWFGELARGLLGKDAGLHLHCITGYPERTCYYYASGARKPPAYFLRALLRSEQGAPFLAALMSGCDAKWWREHQRASDAADQISAVRAIVNKRE